ncbi:OTU domain-containing protein [Spiroplasma endosymbiont of Colias croceus]|uniref:OTU domain-containing protein n=1 Tax=Spiroplasma endosymbiont of Colias croceus TaxID=3066310 RepID=UPI0030D4DEE1
MPVVNDYHNLKKRFIKLFGPEKIKFFKKFKELLQKFNLSNLDNNQEWYRNSNIQMLITQFRRRVIEYISLHLDDNHRQPSRARFREAIVAEERIFQHETSSSQIPSTTTEENLTASYLTRMLESGQWGGTIEIEAMSDLLNTNIIVDNARIESDIDYENTSIQLFHVNRNHYNFGLSNKIENLEKVIVNTNLGFISDNSENTILQSLKEINPELDINQIYIINIEKSDLGLTEVYGKKIQIILVKNI